MEMVQLSIELPRTVFSSIQQDPTNFMKEMRLAAAVKWCEAEMISQAKAAEIAGISRTKFINALNRFHVTPFQYDTTDELIQEATSN